MADPQELALQLANEGGFSLSPAGRWAHSGTMVSRPGAEEVHRGIATPEQISNYQQKHTAEFNRRGYYMGAWVEKTAGNPNLRPGTPVPRTQTVLDVSQRFPSGHHDAANLQGAIHNQRALYDVDKGATPAVTPVLPMQGYGDIEEIHAPKMRSLGSIVGERARRQQAAAQRPKNVQLPMVFTRPTPPGIDSHPIYGARARSQD